MKRPQILKFTTLLAITLPITHALAVGPFVGGISYTEISCGQYGKATVQAALDMWNLRKNAWAMLTMPKDARSYSLLSKSPRRYFDATKSEMYRTQYLKQLASDQTVILPVDFESKLGFLEAMMDWKSDMRSDLSKLFSELEPRKKKAAYKLIQQIMAEMKGGGGGFPRFKLNTYSLQNRLLRLQSMVYESFYPKIYEGMNEATKLHTLEVISRGRFLSFKLSKALVDEATRMGLYQDAAGMRKLMDHYLRGNGKAATFTALEIYMNMNGFIPRAFDVTSLFVGHIPNLPILPKTKLAHWIVIPDEMWEEAMEIGFDKAWETKIKDYVVKKYGNLVKIDTVRHHAVSAYNSVAVTILFGMVAVGGYEQYQAIKNLQKVLNDDTIPSETDEKGNQAPPEKITKEVLNENWKNWIDAHPEAKPGSDAYEQAKSIFSDEE